MSDLVEQLRQQTTELARLTAENTSLGRRLVTMHEVADTRELIIARLTLENASLRVVIAEAQEIVRTALAGTTPLDANAEIAALRAALEPFARADRAIEDEPGPFRFETGTGYRLIEREDLRRAAAALSVQQKEET